MGLFDFLRSPDINSGVSQFRTPQGALLIDVREPDEYAAGHIPGSKNIPLSRLDSITRIVSDKNAPVYVYCLSGGRSARAASMLVALGYKTVNNIGGISAYKGEVER